MLAARRPALLASCRRPLHRALTSSARPLQPFLVERYPGWSTPGAESLTSSECEPLLLPELLALADDSTRVMWEVLSLGYPDQPGSAYLREEIAAQYTTVGAADVNVVAPQEGIYLAMRALLSAGDHVVVTAPCYQSLYEIALSIGCEVSYWRPRLDDPAAPRFCVGDLEGLVRPTTKLVVANWPHNPTGIVPSAADADAIVRLCDAKGARLFVDEMYRGLEHGDRPPLTAACDSSRGAITLGGVSKAHGLPGLRIGWLACRDHAFHARIAELKDYTSICPPAPSELLATIALRAQPTLLAANRARLAAGKAALEQLVARQSNHLEWLEPAGGSFAFVRLRPEGTSAAAYCESLLARTRLLLIPSTLFGYGDDRVRVTFGHDAMLRRFELWEADLAERGLSDARAASG